MSIRHNETFQRMNDMNSKIEISERNINNLFQITTNHVNNIQKLETDLNLTRNNIISTKTSITDALNEQWKNTISLSETTNDKLNSFKETTEDSLLQSQSNTNRINVIETLMNAVSKLSNANEIAIKNLENDKVYVDVYNEDITRINNKFIESMYSIQTLNNKLSTSDDYIDKELPFKIQFIISQTLHAILDNNLRKSLIE